MVHNEAGDLSPADERDVLVQAGIVSETLDALGHDADVIACTLDIAGLKRALEFANPDMVFNLVESVDGRGSLIHLAPALYDAMSLPYTGSSADALFLTSNKVLAKKWMDSHGLDTPEWAGPAPGLCPINGQFDNLPPDTDYIIKSTWEHASFNLEVEHLVAGAENLDALMRERAPGLGGSCFAERFVHGREFNISLLAHSGSVEVLPPAEIVFEGFPEGVPRMVGYRAKWDPESFEFTHTPRRFDFPAGDAALLENLERLARRCWDVFGLAGYARVDFRVDAASRPHILEVNANPCLSPDAGFTAALDRAGFPFQTAVQRILDHARAARAIFSF